MENWGEDRAPPSIWGRGIGGNGHAHRTASGVWGNTEALVWGDGRRGPHSATVLWGKEELDRAHHWERAEWRKVGTGAHRGCWQRGDWGELHGVPEIEGEQRGLIGRDAGRPWAVQ